MVGGERQRGQWRFRLSASAGDASRKKRETFSNLAPLMWHSFGSITILLQEILSVYPALSPPTLTACASSRVCNAIALLQSVASHPETRASFLKAYIPIYLYPLLNTVSNAKSFEYMRLTSLGVIGALVKADDTEAILFLLQSQIIPLCLRIMEIGEELSKIVATFIVERIVLDEVGLQYICADQERFFAVAPVLENMLISQAEQPSARLVKHIICCYLRLADHPRAHRVLRFALPEVLRNGTFVHCFEDDPEARSYLRQLLDKLAAPWVGPPESGAGSTVGGGAPHADPGSSHAGPSMRPGGSPHAWPSSSQAGPRPGEGPPHAGPSMRPGGSPHAGPSYSQAGMRPGGSPHAGPSYSQVVMRPRGSPHAGPGSSRAGPSRVRR